MITSLKDIFNMLSSTKLYRKTFNFIKDPIKTERTSSRHKFSPNVKEEIFMNPENYDTVFLRHTAKHDSECS